MSKKRQKKLTPLAVTMGEPAGVGGEALIKTWHHHRQNLPHFLVIDNFDRLNNLAYQMGIDIPLYRHKLNTINIPSFDECLHIIDTPLERTSIPGELDIKNSSSVISSIKSAVALPLAGNTSGVVTSPIHKSTLYEAGFSYPGHTEFLASLIGPHQNSIMMLTCDQLRVVPVTIHLSLRDALNTLTTQSIIKHSIITCLLYTSPSPRDGLLSRMPSSA